MKKITNDVDVLSIREKESLLKELNQGDLIDLFKGKYKSSYKPIEAKKTCVDQQVSIMIKSEEKAWIQKELSDIKKETGMNISLSSFIRDRSVAEINVEDWKINALEGLKLLNSKEYDEHELTKQKLKYLRLLDNLDYDDKESEIYYKNKIDEYSKKLEEIGRIKPKRTIRLSGRVTLNEANAIRWKAGRLSLSVADYLRFLIFGYEPFTDADKHMTVNDRKRFYISILEICKNGWGTPRSVNECPECARHLQDIAKLKSQLEAYRKTEGV